MTTLASHTTPEDWQPPYLCQQIQQHPLHPPSQQLLDEVPALSEDLFCLGDVTRLDTPVFCLGDINILDTPVRCTALELVL